MPVPVLPVKVLDLHLHLGKSQRTGDRHTEAVLQCRGEKRLFQGNRAIDSPVKPVCGGHKFWEVGTVNQKKAPCPPHMWQHKSAQSPSHLFCDAVDIGDKATLSKG